jgi:oligopeptide transport system substrate-binding protein
MMLLKRWPLPFLALLFVIAVTAFAACGDEDEGEGETETPSERAQGGEITIATLEGDSLSPHFSSFATDISLQRMIWRGLYWLDHDNVPQPMMAAGPPEVSEDGRVYTVRLREGLLWSDGDDLLAEDFVMGVWRTCNPIHGGEYQYLLTNIVGCDDHFGNEAGYDAALEQAIGVRAIDDLTLEFTLNEPQPTFPIILSLWMTFPVPVHLFPNSSDEWPEPAPDAPGKLAYNGPYMLVEYQPGDRAVLEPNPNWAASNGIEPTLDRLTLRFIDDLSVANNAFRTGEVDAANVDLAQLSVIIDEFGEGREYFVSLKPTTIGLEMQMNHPVLGDAENGRNVRLALGNAIDLETMNQTCFQGGRIVTTSWIPEVTGGHPPDAFSDVLRYDPEGAAQLLADAGYPGGEGFPTLSFLVSDTPANRCVADFVKEAYRTNLGIDLKVEVVDAPTRSSRFTNEDFELFPGGWIQDYPDPENWILGLFETDGTLNNYNCSNSEIDSRVEQARFNPDNEERLRLYREINEIIVTEVCGIYVWFHVPDHYIIKERTVGLRENIGGQDGVIAGDWIAEAWGIKP